MLLALDVGNSNTVIGLFKIGTESEPAMLVADVLVVAGYFTYGDAFNVIDFES